MSVKSDEHAVYLKAQHFDSAIRPLLPQKTAFVDPLCPVHPICGGCQLQHVSYENQLEFKRNLVVHHLESEQFSRIDHVEDSRGLLSNPWQYRNKVDLSARTWNEKVHIGFRPHGGKGNLVEMADCPILLPILNDTIRAVRDVIEDFEAFRKRLVSVTIRGTSLYNQTSIFLHSKLRDVAAHNHLIQMAMQRYSGVKGGVYVRKRKEHKVGSITLTEEVNSIPFDYTVRNFFQANSNFIGTLLTTVEELLPFKTTNLLDIYCGVGLFALGLSNRFEIIHGVDCSSSSIEMARRNAARRRASHVHFHRGTAEETITEITAVGHKFDVAIIDPPRSGVAPEVLTALTNLSPPPCIIMVSCNPVTFARDARLLEKKNFHPIRIIPVDMFPQTSHVEIVARFDAP